MRLPSRTASSREYFILRNPVRTNVVMRNSKGDILFGVGDGVNSTAKERVLVFTKIFHTHRYIL